MKKIVFILIGIVAVIYAIACVLVPLTMYAQAEDEYPEWIAWWGGVGMKKYTICDTNGYFVTGMQNFDHGNNNQSAFMTCSKIDAHLPTDDTEHDRCTQQEVEWFGGEGDKPWSHCPDGKYVVGFRIEDYGRNNQAIASMRCCRVAGMTTTHGNSYTTVVNWSGGPGLKTPAECREGYYVTGIRNKDWGRNNQSVGQMRCTQPEELQP